MNYIELTGINKENRMETIFIATELSRKEVAGVIRKLQEFLTYNDYIEKIVDLNTILDFMVKFGYCEIIDEHEAVQNAIDEGQYIMISKYDSVFWNVNVMKAALNINEKPIEEYEVDEEDEDGDYDNY